MLDYKLPYHVIQEAEDDAYVPKLSFASFEEAEEFVKFASIPNLIIIETKEVRDYYLKAENKKFQF